jgi:hypothetical protein
MEVMDLKLEQARKITEFLLSTVTWKTDKIESENMDWVILGSRKNTKNCEWLVMWI